MQHDASTCYNELLIFVTHLVPTIFFSHLLLCSVHGSVMEYVEPLLWLTTSGPKSPYRLCLTTAIPTTWWIGHKHFCLTTRLSGWGSHIPGDPPTEPLVRSRLPGSATETRNLPPPVFFIRPGAKSSPRVRGDNQPQTGKILSPSGEHHAAKQPIPNRYGP